MTRPTPERIAEIRRNVEHRRDGWPTLDSLLAEIDALTAERDRYRAALEDYADDAAAVDRAWAERDKYEQP